MLELEKAISSETDSEEEYPFIFTPESLTDIVSATVGPVEIAEIVPSDFVLLGESEKELFRITKDGEFIACPDIDWNDAAKQFFAACELWLGENYINSPYGEDNDVD